MRWQPRRGMLPAQGAVRCFVPLPRSYMCMSHRALLTRNISIPLITKHLSLQDQQGTFTQCSTQDTEVFNRFQPWSSPDGLMHFHEAFENIAFFFFKIGNKQSRSQDRTALKWRQCLPLGRWMMSFSLGVGHMGTSRSISPRWFFFSMGTLVGSGTYISKRRKRFSWETMGKRAAYCWC